MDDKKTDDLEEVIADTADDISEDEDLEVVEAEETKKISSLQAKLKACQAEKAAHLDDLQRAKAEFLNVRKRLENEKQASVARTENDCIERLLPLCDSFMMAMSDTAAWEAIDENWRKGVESIHSQLQAILKSYHVTPIGVVGESFDPETHEAMGNETVADDTAVDTIVKVIQPGYVRTAESTTVLIRPARVIVGTK